MRDELPGCRVFSKLLKSDNRIDYDELIDFYSPVPSEGRKQNSFWMKIYKKYKYDPMVFELHKKYLSLRDSFAALLSITILGPIFLIIFYDFDIHRVLIFLGWNILALIALGLVVKNRGERFVASVVVHDYC
ncbi:hypothetical protein ABMA70_05050 [Halobacteriovorax sp. XZX-3]|uniref:hypothetical protein n=1 Tax=unclassified Halobacteriovorax TaxID=2639665 RepID=UPI00371FCAF8